MLGRFRKFNTSDYMTYSGVLDLPNGEKPKIASVETEYIDGVDIIISGSGANETLISVMTEDNQYMIVIPGYNRCHMVIAESLIDYFNDYEIVSEAIEAMVSDYDMIKVLD